jgi:hypothetical protein
VSCRVARLESTFLPFRVNDSHDTAIDRTDRQEAVLEFRVRCVEDLEVVDAGLEESLGLREYKLLT